LYCVHYGKSEPVRKERILQQSASGPTSILLQVGNASAAQVVGALASQMQPPQFTSRFRVQDMGNSTLQVTPSCSTAGPLLSAYWPNAVPEAYFAESARVPSGTTSTTVCTKGSDCVVKVFGQNFLVAPGTQDQTMMFGPLGAMPSASGTVPFRTYAPLSPSQAAVCGSANTAGYTSGGSAGIFSATQSSSDPPGVVRFTIPSAVLSATETGSTYVLCWAQGDLFNITTSGGNLVLATPALFATPASLIVVAQPGPVATTPGAEQCAAFTTLTYPVPDPSIPVAPFRFPLPNTNMYASIGSSLGTAQ